MRLFRHAAIASLGLVVAFSSPAIALSSTASPAAASVSPAFEEQLASTPPDAPVGGFIHFSDGRSAAEHADLVTAHGLTVTANFAVVDAVFAVGTAGGFRAIERAPGVVYLQENADLPFTDDTDGFASGVEVVRGPIGGGPFRDDSGRILDGTGVGVAVIDSGVDGTHPDLIDRMAKNFKVVCQTPGLVWASGEKQGQCFSVSFNEVSDSDTSGGHGTHVAGIVAGTGAASEGLFTGVAPGSKLFGFGAGDGASINTLQAASSFQWVLDNGETSTPPVRVITNSYGCVGGCAHNPNDIINKLTNKAVDKGVTVLFSAGNNGSDGDLGDRDDTGNYQKNPKPGVIGVANYDDAGTGHRDNTLDTTSSRGLKGAPATYPDLSAPGALITAPCKRGTALCEPGAAAWAPYYSTLSGTSMATPHTAGAVAILLQARPTLRPDEIEVLLQDNARPFGGGASAPGAYESDPQNPNSLTSYDKGHGLLDIPATLSTLGRTGDANHALAPVAFEVAAPTPGCQSAGSCGLPKLDGVVAVNGSANSTPLPRALISGDLGDYDGPGAADLVGLTLTEDAGAVTYTIGLRDADDVGGSSVLLRINTNANGQRAWTGINVTATSVAPAAFNASTNNVIPVSVTRDLAANTVTAVIPYGRFPSGTLQSLGHNTQISSLTGVIQDVAPGGLGAEIVTHPRNAPEWGFNAMPSGGGTEVRIAIDGGPEAPLGVTEDGAAVTWAGQVDLSGYAPGRHGMDVRLYIDGYRRATRTIPFEIPTRVDTVAPAAPTVTTPAEGSVVGKAVLFSGTTEPGATVRVAKAGTTLLTTKAAKSDGTWLASKTMAGGSHTVAVTATDAAGNVSAATVRSFAVDVTAPTVRFVTANEATFVEDDFTVEGTASDASGIARVVVQYTDATTGRVVATVNASCAACGTSATSVTWTAEPDNIGPGRYRVTATGYDIPGNTATATITVNRI